MRKRQESDFRVASPLVPVTKGEPARRLIQHKVHRKIILIIRTIFCKKGIGLTRNKMQTAATNITHELRMV